MRLSGIIPPVVTPLLSHDQLDVPAVGRIASHLIEGGVSGLFVLGTTGEGPSLNYQIRYEMVECACEAARGKVPVLVGITDSSFAESIHLAEHSAESGATAVVAAAPFYFPVGQQQLVDWFNQLADESPLPVLLYNMPGCVGVDLELDTVVQLSNHPNIIGVKDSSGDISTFERLCWNFAQQDFVVFMGPEELIPQAVAAGADGGVCGGANLLPKLYVGLFNAAKAGDEDTEAELQHVVDEVFRVVYRNPDGEMNLIPGLKHAMHLSGLCGSATAPPLVPLRADHADQISQELSELVDAAAMIR